MAMGDEKPALPFSMSSASMRCGLRLAEAASAWRAFVSSIILDRRTIVPRTRNAVR